MKRLVAIGILLLSASAFAQFGGGVRFSAGGFGGGLFDSAEPRDVDRTGFVYARIKYHVQPSNYCGRGEVPWHHDYPDGDREFPDSLERLTNTQTDRNSYQIVEIDSKELFRYPFTYLSEPGCLDLYPEDVKNFREYLDRGGFVLVDDFRGYAQLENLVYELKKVYPDRDIEHLDASHPIFSAFFEVPEPEKMTPPYRQADSGDVQFLGLSDKKGRLQMIIDFNNDLSEYWQLLYEGNRPFFDSATAVRLGTNYAIYAMTH